MCAILLVIYYFNLLVGPDHIPKVLQFTFSLPFTLVTFWNISMISLLIFFNFITVAVLFVILFGSLNFFVKVKTNSTAHEH